MPDSPVTPSQFQAVISSPNTSMCGNFINTLLKLPVLIYEVFNAWLDANGNFTDAFLSGIKPVGSLEFSACALPASGRLLCNGQEVSRTTYAALFAAIGTTFGTPSSGSVFKVPDYSEKFPRGLGAGSIGESGGEATHVLVEAELPAHRHLLAAGINSSTTLTSAAQSIASSDVGGGDEYLLKSGGATEPTIGRSSAIGSDTAHNNLPPYLSCYIYIRA